MNNCLIYIKGNNCKIDVDKHCVINKTEFWIEDDFSSINIGSKTTIESAHIASTEGKTISIGNECMFSTNIQIRNGDSHSIYDKTSQVRINKANSVLIKDYVWLGSDVKVLKGTTINENSVIGSGSIVTNNVSPNSIYVGSPAKNVNKNIYWNRER